AVGSGNTAIEVKNTLFSTVDPSERWHSDAATSLSVAAGGSSGSDKQTTTETATETTTAAKTSSGGSGGGSSSGGGSGSSSGKVSTTEETTKAESETGVIIEETVETTTQGAPETAKTVSFGDLSGVSWAVPYINDLAAKGVVNGYADGTFKPNANVKRCDFVVMLAKALDLPEGEDNFSDVADGAYYAKAVSAAKAAKIVNGNTDGTFAPNSLITRQDMMVIAKGALEYAGIETDTNSAVLADFADNAQISAYAKDSAAAMVNAGIVSGSNGKIEPKGNTTRAQAAVIISKICEKIK
ncbi:MAG: S-layer homology domain-containing protein, partial [Firmicutes bacterium]|nr:S-layer homology domain-containing protein [Bacillota bacterium]